MKIHKEGYTTLIVLAVVLVVLHIIADQSLSLYPGLRIGIMIGSVISFLIVLQFFRHPTRRVTRNDNHIIAPADGKVVVIEVAEEKEILKDKRIQLSIFMSPLNVHVNRYPVSGKITYCRYHSGDYTVAWHPKSSEENERTTVVIETSSRIPVLVRQIAGAMARRIVCYPKKDWIVKQGEEMGFIKFGSRVDLFLPVDTKIQVQLNQKVRGGETILAEFK